METFQEAMHQEYLPQTLLLRTVGNLKRGAEDYLLNAGQLFAPVMTVDSEAKKAKLDPTALIKLYQMNNASGVLGAPISHVAQSCASSSSSSQNTANSNNNNNNPPGGSNPRSRVIHIRNIPPDMVDVELIQLCIPYGPISNYMMLKGKSQAFVEYEDESSAVNFVTGMNNVPIQIRGRTIFAQFSTHQELKLDKDKKNGDDPLSLQNGAHSSNLDISGGTQQAPSSVLRVIIENMLYPVTLDILFNLFSRFGKVLRIITFNKNNTFQALIQMSESNAAQEAKRNMENQNVFSGYECMIPGLGQERFSCCTLRIDFSKLSTLNVKYNNDKSRDYTNPSLPSGEITIEQSIQLGLHSFLPTATPYSFTFTNPASAYLQAQAAAAESANSLSYIPTLGATLSGATIGHPATTVSPLRLPVNLLGVTSVILVSNLDETHVTPDALFTLFGVYGDVLRVKILYNKKDNALIQYSEPQQAQLSIQHLDKVRWHDKVIRVAPSKHNNVQLPKEGQPDAGLTRDYSHSPLHRFKKPGSKNYMNIYPPSSTLHLSNIPPGVDDNVLTDLFENAGFSVKAFKFFPKDRKMALLQLDDVETAIEALIIMHNTKLAENAHLRVSFSKSGI